MVLRESYLLLLCFLAACNVLHSEEIAKWRDELRVGRFEIHADFALKSQKQLIIELGQIRADVEDLLKLPESSETIHIVLFATEEEYRRYMGAYFPELPHRRALFLQHRGPGMLFTHWHPGVAADLRHEVTHALINQSGVTMPLWLDEGLAEYFEASREDRFGGNSYLSEVRALSGKGQLQSLTTLQQKVHFAELRNSDYRDSWAWVHFMLHRSAQTRGLLLRYLSEHRALPKQVSTEKAVESQPAKVFDLQRALLEEIPDLRKQLREHFAAVSRTGGIASKPASHGPATIATLRPN